MALYNADSKIKPYFSQQKNPPTWNLLSGADKDLSY